MCHSSDSCVKTVACNVLAPPRVGAKKGTLPFTCFTTITRHGRTAAFMISPRDMQDLLDARRKRNAAVDAFEVWSQKAAASALPAADSLTDEAVLDMVKASR